MINNPNNTPNKKKWEQRIDESVSGVGPSDKLKSNAFDVDSFVNDVLNFEPKAPRGLETDDTTSGNFKEGLEQGWKGLSSGYGKFVGETLDLVGADDLGKRVQKGAELYGRDVPQSDGSKAQFFGSLIPSVVPSAIAIGSTPFTGGSSLIPLTSMGLLGASSAGNGMMEYQHYKESQGKEVDELSKWGVGLSYGVAEVLAERFSLGKLIPSFGAGKGIIKGDVVGAEKMGKKLLEKYSQYNPSGYKSLVKKVGTGFFAEGGEEVITEVAQTLTNTLFKEKDDIIEEFKGMPENMLKAFIGGGIMGAGLGPLSYGVQNNALRQQREANGKVILAELESTGDVVELLAPIVDEKNPGYNAIDKNGESVFVAQNDVVSSAELSLEQYEKLLQDKLDTQTIDIATRPPKYLATYGDKVVEVTMQEGDDGAYIKVDGVDKYVKLSELENIEEVSGLEQAISEGQEIVDQPITTAETLRAEGKVIQDENGDFLYPDDEGYDEVLANMQQSDIIDDAIAKSESKKTREVTIGAGNKKMSLSLRDNSDGTYGFNSIRRVVNGEVQEVDVESLTLDEVGMLRRDLDKDLKQRGLKTEAYKIDPDDAFSPMNIRVVSKEQAKEEKEEKEEVDPIENYTLQFNKEGKVEVLNQEGDEVGSRSKYYLPKVKAFFTETAQEYANLPRVTDDDPTVTEANYLDEVARYSENPLELSEAYLTAIKKEEEGKSGSIKENAIALDLLGSFIPPSDLDGRGLDSRIARANYVREGADTDIAQRADYLSDQLGQEVTIDDIIDFIKEHPGGARSVLNQRSEEVVRLEERFKDVTGANISPSLAESMVGSYVDTSNEQVVDKEKDRALEAKSESDESTNTNEFDNIDDSDLESVGNRNFTAEIEALEQELRNEGVTDEEIEAIKQEADELSGEEIEALESEIEAETNDQEVTGTTGQSSTLQEDVGIAPTEAEDGEDSANVMIDNADDSPDSEYSSTQFNLDIPEVVEFGKSIPKDELYVGESDAYDDYGVEEETHVTALYGLTTDNADEVRKVVEGFGEFNITLGKTSLFENEEYDVLKIDVESKELRDLNKLIDDSLDNENSFPDYKPHITIAYLKPGEGKKYSGDTRFEGKNIPVSELLFSGKDRAKTAIDLNSQEILDSSEYNQNINTESITDDESSQKANNELDEKEAKAKEELDSLFNEFGSKFGNNINSGIDPEAIKLSAKIIAKGAELGFIKFQQFAKYVIDAKGSDFWRRIFPNFKASYVGNVALNGNVADEDLNKISKSTADDWVESTESAEKTQQSSESTGTKAVEGAELTEQSSGIQLSSKAQNSGKKAFKKLNKYFDLNNLPDEYYEKYGETGDAIMPFAIEKQRMGAWLLNREGLDDKDAYVLILEQFYIQNGDLMSDPRIDVAVYPNLGLVIPINYNQDGIRNGYKSYTNDGKLVDEKGMLEANKFLTNTWLPNLESQHFNDSSSDKTTAEVPDSSGNFQTEKDFIRGLVQNMHTGTKLNKTALEKFAKDYGIEDVKRIKELAEYAVLKRAQEIVDTYDLSFEETYNELVSLYEEKQPSLTARTSSSIMKQQYSTPVPVAFAMGKYVNLDEGVAGLEPSAGNGLLTVASGTKQSNIIANEIDTDRLDMLREQGFHAVTDQDGTKKFESLIKTQQAVITNPPFGATDSSVRDSVAGRIITLEKLEHIMTLRALDTMRDDGKASIIIGGNDNWGPNDQRTGEDAKFFHYLYHNYNVEDVINLSGNIFRRQGANFPTRVILINGRKDKPNGLAPSRDRVKSTQKIIGNLTDFYERINTHISGANNEPILQPQLDERRTGENTIPSGDTEGSSDSDNTGTGTVPGGRSNQDDSGGRTGSTSSSGPTSRNNESSSRGNGRNGTSSDNNGELGLFNNASEGTTENESRSRSKSSDNEGAIELVQREKSKVDSRISVEDVIDSKGGNIAYSSLSDNNAIGTEMPSSMAHSMVLALNKLADKVGNVDNFVQEKLGYKTQEELFEALSAEQIDAVALAIDQIQNNKSLIVGDQTGIGKGRVAAAIIRYTRRQGLTPVFFTEKNNLMSDMYRDLSDIGSSKLKPFIVNGGTKVVDTKNNNKVVHKTPSTTDQERIFKNPESLFNEGYDYVSLTYSQISSEKYTTKRKFLAELGPRSIFIFDESHNASGQSNTGQFIMKQLEEAKGAVYLSATFAKRPDNMPVYAMKTDIAEASLSTVEMIEAIEMGGVALQEILSSELVKSGQMVRRQRSFKGVKRDFTLMGVDDKGNLTKDGVEQRELYDQVAQTLRDIIEFQQVHVAEVLSEKNKDLKDRAKEVAGEKGVKKAGVDNAPFVSRIHNVIDQLLFSVKVDAVVEKTLETLKNDKKPVIAIKSTMESMLKDTFSIGEQISNAEFGVVLERALNSIMKYSEKDGVSQTKVKKQLTRGELTASGRAEYDRIIDDANNIVGNLVSSPIDYIVKKLEDAGYKVGEVTGRGSKIELNDDYVSGKYVNRKEG